MNKIILYHGSEKVINSPQYKFKNNINDFGEGFYCTEDIEIAKEWACKGNSDGFINKYTLNTNGLKIINLLDDKYNILNWISILLKYRVFHKKNSFNVNIKKYIMKYYVDVESYDVVIGYRCDDSFFRYTKDFLNNRITLNQLEQSLLLGNLGNQTVIKSKKAFDNLKYIENEKILKDEYYLKFFRRDINSRKEYEKIFNKANNINDVYIMDLIRQDLK